MLNWLKQRLSKQLTPTRVAPEWGDPQQHRLDLAPIAPESNTTTILEGQRSEAIARWIFPGEASIKIADYVLTDGMIYVGDALSGVSDRVSIEPCLICPQLKVDSDKPDREGHWMTHWPSYSEIPSACRAAYLEWLAHGRNDPDIHISYVFLFLYGLERRVLHDLRNTTEDCTQELTDLMAEVERLMVLYGHNESFLRDAGNFLEVCWFLQSPQGLVHRMPSSERLPLRLTLGRLAQTQYPLPANWALAWALSLGKTSAVATHCLPELQSLFRVQYHQQFGDGLCLERIGPSTPLTQTYQPASVSFGGPIALLAELPELPSDCIEVLQPLVEACTETLTAYERWISRNPEQRGSAAAVLRLPAEIAHQHEQAEVTQFRQWATECLREHEFQIMPVAELWRRWTPEPIAKLAKADAVTLAQFLERQGIGIEPDVRFGGKPAQASQNIVLFQCLNGVLVDPSPRYSTAQLLLHLAAVIVTASGTLDPIAMTHVQKYLAWTPRLQEPERDRLLAHFQWLCHNKLTLRGLKSRLEELGEAKTIAIATFLISTVKASEHHLAAVDALTKLYPLLGFEADQVYPHLHSTAPITLPQTTHLLSSETRELTGPEVGLNLDLIQRRQDESQAVSAMLADIFVETDAPSSIQLGLDEAHSTLLMTLAKQTHWHREDLETVAAELNLMLDGALENINEIAFEQCDQALIEGEEPLEINPDILEALLTH
jgi:hypothetical protein